MIYNSIFRYITEHLQYSYSTDEAKALAWWVLEELTGKSRAMLMLQTDVDIDNSVLENVMQRLIQHEPIQYIFGHTLWNGLDLKVSPAVLIPRPETAELIELVKCKKSKNEVHSILDIGTGSGCIAIGMKKVFPDSEVTGLDISEEALEIARENAVRNNFDVQFLQCDILDENSCPQSVNRMFDIIISNPPYIAESEKATMDTNVLEYEPQSALFVPDTDPLLFYRRISCFAASHLYQGGLLAFEINQRFGRETKDIVQSCLPKAEVELLRDNYGNDRFIIATIS